MRHRWGIIITGVLLSSPAWAASYDQIVSMIDGKAPDADVVKEIKESKDIFLPRHVYAMIDREVSKEIIQAIAAKAAIFYNGTQLSLQDQREKAYAEVPTQTISIRSDADWGKFFEFFDAVKAEADVAKTKVDPVKQNTGEADAVYDKRARAYEEMVIYNVAPIEGRIKATTFDIEVPATLEAYDANAGCYPAAIVNVDLNSYAYQSWRAAMGGALTLSGVTIDKKSETTVVSIAFNGGNPRRLEAKSRRICPYENQAQLAKDGVKLKMQIKRTPKGQDWTGTAVFVNAKTGEKVEAKK